MFNLIKKNLNPYCAFAVLCALITLLPVINYSLSTPADLVVTLVIWVLSNMVTCSGLFFYSRRHKVTKRLMAPKSTTETRETHLMPQITSESALQQ